ncbi:MAG: hypothetical protein LBH00_05310, partial [Planctomycetaceae bacterium]|nr:hypothetical protein [Planctomycetaceae bacterium]
MFCFLFAVIVFGFGFLLYSYYRDQKQEKNSYRTNTFHICRIEVLEERDFLSASPLGDFYNDDNDDYEPPCNPCDTYIEYNAYSNAAAQQAAPVPSIIAYENVTGITNSGFMITDAASLSNLNTLPNSFTFDVTFKADTVSGWNYLICHDSENNTGAEIFLRIRDGKLQFGYWDTYQNHLTETAVS